MSTDMKQNKRDNLKIILGDENLGIREESDWDVLVDHVDVHKYLINQNLNWTITWNDAVFSWYENVYIPLKRLIKQWQVRQAFPNMTQGQLFIAVSNHWYFLQESSPKISAEEAVGDYAAAYGHGLGRILSKFIPPTAA